MSPSKKANDKSSIKIKSARKAKKTYARPIRVPAKKARARPKPVLLRTARGSDSSAAAKTLPTSAQTIQPQTLVESKTSNLKTNILRVAALLAVVGISVFIYSIRDRVQEFERFGYAGIFIVALMANATILLPAPGLAIIYAMGSIFNPLGVGLAAGTGGALGELSGYLAGFSGQAIVERMDMYNRVKPWVEKYGGWAIMVLSAIPNPVFDVVGVAAGIVKMPMRTFLISVWIGQLIKMTVFAYAGQSSMQVYENFIK